MTTTSRHRRMLKSVLVFIAFAAVVAIPVAIVLSAGDDGELTAAHHRAERGRPVMPGHGSVMPTDVRADARPGEFVVAVGDYWFKPSSRSLRAGRYRLVAQSYGVVAHDVMVERVPIAFEAPNQPVDEAAPYGIEDVVPGVRKSATVVLGPGRWAVFCSISGHYVAGQHFTLDVHGRLPVGMRERTMGM
jgi:uncharacterized cupredoxin-like copper-binding protein